jgi:hypothetical protein
MHTVAVVGGWRARFELLLLVRPTNRCGQRQECCTLATAIPAKSERGKKKRWGCASVLTCGSCTLHRASYKSNPHCNAAKSRDIHWSAPPPPPPPHTHTRTRTTTTTVELDYTPKKILT